MTPNQAIETKLQTGMVEGNMHACLRDVGRLAGGFYATGALTGNDIDHLQAIAVRLAINPAEAEQKWAEAVGFGKGEPVKWVNGNGNGRRREQALDWDDVISGDYQIFDPDSLQEEAVNPPEDWDPVEQLTTFLNTIFEPEDQVGYVTKSWLNEESGERKLEKGLWDRSAGQLIEELSKCNDDIKWVIGDWDPEVGAWIRFNPLDGKGIKDANVTDYRFALVESDVVEIPKQYALLKELELPIATLTHSGGKSLHAIVRVDAKNLKEYKERVKFLYEVCDKHGLKVDPQNCNPSRLSRMPGVTRNGNKQFLKATNIGKASWIEWQEHVENADTKLRDLIFARLFDAKKRPPPIREVFRINGTVICTPGNLSTIAAQIKVGKSSFCAAAIAATMSGPDSDCDCFGIEGPNPDHKALIYLDTEQSLDDFWHLVHRAMVRAKVETPPDWLYAFSLAGLNAEECRKAVPILMKELSAKHGGVHSLIIDGIADLVYDVNQADECNKLVANLHGLAIHYDCPIIGVIHMNPKSQRGSIDKVRGHLGSQLERKSETNLNLEKDGDVTVVWSEKQRRAPISKETGPRFTWDDNLKMHASIDPANCTPSKHLAEKEQDLLELAKDVFEKTERFTQGDLAVKIMDVGRYTGRATADRKIKAMVKAGVVIHSGKWYSFNVKENE